MPYSLRTEEAYRYWVRFFVRWSGRGGSMRHPRDMGAPEVQKFLSMLANERQVSASTHNQALRSCEQIHQSRSCHAGGAHPACWLGCFTAAARR
ncbi:site-specific integrase [Thiomonas bhubaneswarensis]|uniref:site-specific integrase n=1 Tax=Thiomonas bhubaneswarensis TaxID=339866 RepID=UPI0009E85F8A